jgi:protein phosphatase
MIAINDSDLIIGHQTHAGETGKNNEDRALTRAYKGLAGEKGEVTLAVVADGIGGHRAGEIASQIAVDTFADLFNQTDSRAYLDLFARAFASIQQTIAGHIAENSEAEGMGTTCSAVAVANRRLYIAFIGDSRIYLIRDGMRSIRQISVDHTWVQEAIEHGILTKAEARKHPNRHVVRRHLGAGQDPTPDFRLQLDDSEKAEAARHNQGLALKPGDIVLLSSDGMTDLVEDHEILANFSDNRSPQEAVESLVLLARQRGGFDNITITALKIPDSPGGRIGSKQQANGFAPAMLGGLLAGVIGVALLALLVVGGYFYFYGNPFQPTATPTPTATPLPTVTPTRVMSATPTPQPAILQPDTPTPLPPTATRTRFPTFTATSSPSAATVEFELTASWLTVTAQSQGLTETATQNAPTTPAP